MELLEGAPLTDYAAIRSITSRDPEEVLVGALNTWFGSVVACETFHADVHAGRCLLVVGAGGGCCNGGVEPHVCTVECIGKRCTEERKK